MPDRTPAQPGPGGDIRLLLGDCLERMAEIEDGSVDLIAADLPFGTTQNGWDSAIPLEPLWAHYRRILTHRGAVVLTASQPFTTSLVASNPGWFRYDLVWEKDRTTGHLDARRRPLRSHESILVFSPRGITYNPQLRPKATKDIRPATRGGTTSCYGAFVVDSGRTIADDLAYPKSVLRFNCPNRGEQGLHPTQKPVALFEYLIRTYSNPGDLVLDNTMGSATTGVACLNTGRRFVGIEKDPEIFATAERRIKQEIDRTLLLIG